MQNLTIPDRGEFSASVPLLDPNITLVIDPEIPESETYVGPDGVRSYMSGFLGSFESLRIAAESFQEVGDTILVKVRQSGVGEASGAPVEFSYFQLWTFGGSKVVHLHGIMSVQRALEAVGLRGEAGT